MNNSNNRLLFIMDALPWEKEEEGGGGVIVDHIMYTPINPIYLLIFTYIYLYHSSTSLPPSLPPLLSPTTQLHIYIVLQQQPSHISSSTIPTIIRTTIIHQISLCGTHSTHL
jgi:hypothetical protein